MRKKKPMRNDKYPADGSEQPLAASVEVAVGEINLSDYQIVDIREVHEVAAQPLPCEHIHIPMNELLSQPELLDKDRAYLLVCAAGVRTQYTANAFRAAGYRKVCSLIGGNRMLS